MKNFVAVVALIISVGGIFVTLAREEMRCYLGLASVECGVLQQTAPPESKPTTAKEARREEGDRSEPTHTGSKPQTQPTHTSSESRTEPKTVEKPAKREVEQSAQKSHAEPSKSQPIEVIPPPEAANKSENEGQPIEVIPPPEEHQH